MKSFALLLLFSICSINALDTQFLSPEEILDLQILTTYQGTPGFLKRLNKTLTQAGTDYLTHRVLNPISNTQQLIKRQKALIAMGNEQLASTLEASLLKFQQNEQALDAFRHVQDPIAKQAIDNLYFKNRYLKPLNAHPAGLDFAQVAHTLNMVAPMVEHAAIHFFVSEALHEYLGMCCSSSHHDHGHKDHTHEHKEKKHHDKPHKHKDHAHEKKEKEHKHEPPSRGKIWAYRAYNALHTIIHVMNLKELIEHMQERAATLNTMQQQLIQVRNCVDAARELVNSIESMDPDLFESQTRLRAVVHNDAGHISAELSEFITLLEKNTFGSRVSLFSRPGNILRAYTLALKVMPELMQAFEGVGELDTLRSCSQLLQSDNQTQPFCLAEFVDYKNPCIGIGGYWNLLNKNPRPIQEPLYLGGKHAHVAIITGANKSGKSTATAAVVQAIVCAQSLGIAPAQSCQLVPFSAIRTCLNANTKVVDGKSLFSASIEFADNVLELNRRIDGATFIATDELFNSTEFSRGKLINEQMARLLATNERIIGIISTHFASATELEKELSQDIINLRAHTHDFDGTTLYHVTPGSSEAQDPLELIGASQLLRAAGLQ